MKKNPTAKKKIEMDRNTIIGLLLIAAILIGYSMFTKPNREKQAEMKRVRDSIEAAEQIKMQEEQARMKQQFFNIESYAFVWPGIDIISPYRIGIFPGDGELEVVARYAFMYDDRPGILDHGEEEVRQIRRRVRNITDGIGIQLRGFG